MTIAEIQDILNNREFDKFNGDDTSLWIGLVSYQLADLNYNEDFFRWLFEKSNYNYWRTIVINDEDIFKKFTTEYYIINDDEMKYFIDFLFSVGKTSYVGNSKFNDLTKMPTNTLDILFKKLDVENNMALKRIYYIQDRQIDALSSESIDKFTHYVMNKKKYDKRWYEALRSLFGNFGYDNIIKIIGKYNFQEIIEFCSHEHRVNFRQFQTIGNTMTSDDVFKWIDDLYKKKSYVLLQYVPKYFNGDVKLSDDDIEKLIQYNNNDTMSIHTNSLTKFNKEQFLKLDKVTPDEILKCKDTTLVDFAEIADEQQQKNASFSIMRNKRYTEEEMLEYPFMFAPQHLNEATDVGLYFSKKTLTILNKMHGKRQRYYEDDMTLERLMMPNIRYRENFNFTDKYFHYLIEKTKASNDEILRTISRYSTRIGNNPLKKYIPLTDLLKED